MSVTTTLVLAFALATPGLGAQEAPPGAVSEADAVKEVEQLMRAKAAHGGSLSNEDLPVNIRLAIKTQSLVAMVQKDPETAQRWVRYAGHEVDIPTLEALGEIYGDFNERLGERAETELTALADQPELRAAAGREHSLELAAAGGEALGRWSVLLRDQGHDVGRLLHDLINRPNQTMSVNASNGVVLEELEEEAARFGESFQREFGSAPEALVEAN